MRIAAYCRVSTEKEDQLNSLAAQKQFFQEYTRRTGDELVRLYADEGLSGTRVRNRRAFQAMMADAPTGLFEQVVVKDISRFARNTVDLLQNIRTLRGLGIETRFLTADMTGLGSSEFVLTLFGALAQEESLNTSKRVKFGKRLNAEKGRVPNLVFGYEKLPGDCFHLRINQEQARTVQEIFHLYTREGWGTSRIAALLNDRGILTGRGCRWSQTAVCRVLDNELYIGRVINGKQEVTDFLTGARRENPRDQWLICQRPELAMVDPAVFWQAQTIRQSRRQAMAQRGERHSGLYPLSNLLKCPLCGRSFRRMVRTYRNTYVRWVCSGQDCANGAAVQEEDLLAELNACFAGLLRENGSPRHWQEQLLARCREREEQAEPLRRRIQELDRRRDRLLSLCETGAVSPTQLRERLFALQTHREQCEQALADCDPLTLTQAQQQQALQNAFPDLPALVSVPDMTAAQLRRIVSRIEIWPDGTARVFPA